MILIWTSFTRFLFSVSEMYTFILLQRTLLTGSFVDFESAWRASIQTSGLGTWIQVYTGYKAKLNLNQSQCLYFNCFIFWWPKLNVIPMISLTFLFPSPYLSHRDTTLFFSSMCTNTPRPPSKFWSKLALRLTTYMYVLNSWVGALKLEGFGDLFIEVDSL